MSNPRFEKFEDLIDEIDLGAIDVEKCSIYFDGGVFYITSKEYGRLLDDGNIEEALAYLLDMEIGTV